MPLFSMLAKGFSVVRGDGNDRVLIQPVPPQDLDNAADNRIGVRDLAVVREGGVVGLEWLRRVILFVGIVEVQTDKKQPVMKMDQPAQYAVSIILREPLH